MGRTPRESDPNTTTVSGTIAMSEAYPITRSSSGKPFRCLMVKSGDLFSIVDAEDYDWLNENIWHHHNGYVRRSKRYGSSARNAAKIMIFMHRAIMETYGPLPYKSEIDHINLKPFDNRRSNLRIVTRSGNMLNTTRSRARIGCVDPIDEKEMGEAVGIELAIKSAPPQYGPIVLTKGRFAEVDEIDFEWAMQWKWCMSPSYAVRKGPKIGGKQSTIYMHVEIGRRGGLLGPLIDHIDGDGIDNRRSNLRSATKAQNCQNSRRSERSTTGFKGVHYLKDSGVWIAHIKKNRKQRRMGPFSSPENAHEAYKKAAVELFGEFARFE